MNKEIKTRHLSETGKYLFRMAYQLHKPEFSIKDIGISHKQVNNWRVQEVLLSNEAKGRRGQNPFSMMDYIWLRMLENLREIGVHIPIIKKAREELLSKAPIDEVLFTTERVDNRKEEEIDNTTEWLSVFDFFVINAISQKENLAIFIDEEGQAYPYSASDPLAWLEAADLKSLMQRPFVSVSISEIIKEIVDLGEEQDDDRRLILISEEEREVLDLIRNGELTDLHIRFDASHEIELIEATRQEKIELKNRFMDVITREGYQDISFTTQRGKVVQFKNTTKIKPKKKNKIRVLD
jgi:DNA-binding transcriptional MerR regulator